MNLRVALVIACLLPIGSAFGQDKPKDAAPPPPPAERLVERRSAVTIAGQKVDYVSNTGTYFLRDEEGKPQASIFFVSYHRVKVTEPPAPMGPPPPTPPAVQVSPPDPTRPITFCFNGGPGSSSVWLHLGAWGPKKAFMPDDGTQPQPPAKLEDNTLSLLDITDLVFIDPVSTGYSRAAPGVDPKRYHGVQEDVAAMGEFIRLYLTRQQRWGSPKYIAGESYGTTRAAALAAYMQDSLGVELSGVILVSSILNFATTQFNDGNDLPYALFLPTYTATAYFHKKLPGDMLSDLPKALAESEQFASTDYTLALMKGDRLTADERTQLAQKLSRLTGLSGDFITRANYRVDGARFQKELLRDQGKIVGRYDARLTGTDGDMASDRPESDPSYAAVNGAFTGAINQYLRRDLGFDSDLKYEILTGRVNPWDFGVRNRYLNVANQLAAAMRKNATMRVFVASGCYDLATPYFATDYTFRHMGLDAEAQKRLTLARYEAGHMMYIHRKSHEQLRNDLANFYAGK
jgi:carboxypeptidase C (cathepsin A)